MKVMSPTLSTLRPIGALAALSLAAWSSCLPTSDVDPDEPQTWPTVCVTLDMASTDATVVGETRATAPVSPDVENLIYDLWVLQFVKDDEFAQIAKWQHWPAVGGVVKVKQSVELYALDSYICVVANHNPDDETQEFSALFDKDDENLVMYETFANFCEALATVDLTPFSDRTARMMWMSGYWEGTPKAEQTLSVPLSRMMTRINVTIQDSTGTNFFLRDSTIKKKFYPANPLTLTLSNIPQQTHLFSSEQHDTLPPTAYATTSLTDEVGVANGGSASLYYYIAPNFCKTKATTLNITTRDNNRHASIVLGTDAPGVDSRDLNLYPNTTYNFTITLRSN